MNNYSSKLLFSLIYSSMFLLIISVGENVVTYADNNFKTEKFLVAVNINPDSETDQPESSGTLPGASFSPESHSYLLNSVDRPHRDPCSVDLLHERFDPKLLKRSQEEFLIKQLMGTFETFTYTVGDQRNFWIWDDHTNTDTQRQIMATCHREGVHAYIFVDNGLMISEEILDLYITEFDEIMYPLVSQRFGDFSDIDGNGKIVILLANFASDVRFGGYFNPLDYYNDTVTMNYYGEHSNEMDLLYVNGNPEGWSPDNNYEEFYKTIITTLIHEYQHMVNFGITVWEQGDEGQDAALWINEMMSDVSIGMYFREKLRQDSSYSDPEMVGNGYVYQRIYDYNMDKENIIRNGWGLTYWDISSHFYNYSLSYLFGEYLALHSSNEEVIFRDILNYMTTNHVNNYQAVAEVARQNITGISTWEDLLKNWAMANILNEPEGPYGYKGEINLTAHGATSSSVQIHNSGVVYRNIEEDFIEPMGAGPNIRFFTCEKLIPINTTTSTPPETTTTTTSPNSTTTTTISSGPCAAEAIYGENSQQTELLREYRDNVLCKTPEGQEIVKIYYKFSPPVTKLLENRPLLKNKAKAFIDSMLPGIKKKVEGSNKAP